LSLAASVGARSGIGRFRNLSRRVPCGNSAKRLFALPGPRVTGEAY
jgi:hypothetical protein